MTGQPPFDGNLAAAAAGAPRRGRCPADERLLAFYRGEIDEAGEETVRDHLASCADCVARARDARDFVATVGANASAAPAARWRRGAWLGLAAVLAGFAIIGIWTVRRGSGPPPPGPSAAIDWSGLAVAPAPYLPGVAPGGAGGDVVYREGAPGDPFAAAMRHYSEGDFVAAESSLEALVSARAGGQEARFYLAVTRLINGHAEDARRELMELERSDTPVDSGQIGWYLALATMKTGRIAEARQRLEAVVAGGGAHAGEAAALLDRMHPGAGR